MTPTVPVLSPVQIDELCMAFDKADTAKDEAGATLSEAKGELYAADATEGSTIEINEASVAELQSELSRLKKPAVFKKLFARRVSHQLATKDGAGVLKLALGHMDEAEQKRVLAIFAGCFTVGIKAPSVRVNLIAALREREEKAAKKSAKKAGK